MSHMASHTGGLIKCTLGNKKKDFSHTLHEIFLLHHKKLNDNNGFQLFKAVLATSYLLHVTVREHGLCQYAI